MKEQNKTIPCIEIDYQENKIPNTDRMAPIITVRVIEGKLKDQTFKYGFLSKTEYSNSITETKNGKNYFKLPYPELEE